ncbi:MAG: septum formation protein Maf [Paludibacter sp.]|nr:MAG: septum formation protein Maf [Paludibacter sp.]
MSFPLDVLKDFDIILASQSPRRRALLQDMGLQFRSTTIEIEESYPSTLPATEVAEYLSRLKANAYLPTINSHELIICADTTVVLNNRILGKPQNANEAKKMLTQLSGKCHQVISGVSVRTSKGIYSFSDTTEVCFSNLTKADINYYVETAMPLDKAGAYGIQEWIGMIGINYIKGCFYNVMGFPTAAFYRFLQTKGKDLL